MILKVQKNPGTKNGLVKLLKVGSNNYNFCVPVPSVPLATGATFIVFLENFWVF